MHRSGSGERQSAEVRTYILQAFCNVGVSLLTFCWISGIVAAYALFVNFFKPLIWAVICGITIYPVKRQMSRRIKGWLDSLLISETPLTIAIVTLPVGLSCKFGDFLLGAASNSLLAVGLILATFPTVSLLLHLKTVPKFLLFLTKFFMYIDRFVSLFGGKWAPFAFFLYWFTLFVCRLLTYNYGKVRFPMLHNNVLLCFVWATGVGYCCCWFGSFRTPLYIALVVICCWCYFGVPAVADHEPRGKADGRSVSESVESNDMLGDVAIEESNEADLYLKWLTLSCFFVWISLRLWLMSLLAIPLACFLVCRFASLLPLKTARQTLANAVAEFVRPDLGLIYPPPARCIHLQLKRLDRKIISYLRKSIDFVSSIASLLLLLLCFVGAAAFIGVQVYHESVNLVYFTKEIGDQLIVHNPGFQDWLKRTTNADSFKDLIESSVEKGYGAGRVWISGQISELMGDDEEKSKTLEQQVLAAFDSFVYTLIQKNETAQQRSLTEVMSSSWETFTSLITASSLEKWAIIDRLKEQISLIWALAQSTFYLTVKHMEVLMLHFGNIMSTIFASGSAVINFFLNATVFLTFLLFLLQTSEDEFKPLNMLKEYMPVKSETALVITMQIEQAVKGVFLATLKMALFYGMFTWLTHTLLAVTLVFTPSIFAAIFAAIPFLGTTVVAIPAALELWLIRGEPVLALFLFIVHYLVPYFVDDSIYSEIKLTTPFLTGLAIAGGMLLWGLEGAIFGPLVLCCLLVLAQSYTAVVKQRSLLKLQS